MVYSTAFDPDDRAHHLAREVHQEYMEAMAKGVPAFRRSGRGRKASAVDTASLKDDDGIAGAEGVRTMNGLMDSIDEPTQEEAKGKGKDRASSTRASKPRSNNAGRRKTRSSLRSGPGEAMSGEINQDAPSEGMKTPSGSSITDTYDIRDNTSSPSGLHSDPKSTDGASNQPSKPRQILKLKMRYTNETEAVAKEDVATTNPGTTTPSHPTNNTKPWKEPPRFTEEDTQPPAKRPRTSFASSRPSTSTSTSTSSSVDYGDDLSNYFRLPNMVRTSGSRYIKVAEPTDVSAAVAANEREIPNSQSSASTLSDWEETPSVDSTSLSDSSGKRKRTNAADEGKAGEQSGELRRSARNRRLSSKASVASGRIYKGLPWDDGGETESDEELRPFKREAALRLRREQQGMQGG